MRENHPIEYVPVELASTGTTKCISNLTAMPQQKWFLLSEWIAHFLTAQVPSVSSIGVGSNNVEGRSTWKCTTHDNAIGAEFDDLPTAGVQCVTTWGISQESHDRLIRRATEYAVAGRTRKVFWHATFSSKDLDPFTSSTALHFVRGWNHARRLSGKVFFGPDVLLDFEPPESATPKPPIFAAVHARAYFLVDGVFPGPFTSQLAKAWVPDVRACVSFCLGTPLHVGKFRKLGAHEEADLAASLQTTPVNRQLAIEHLSLGEVLHTFVMKDADETRHKLLRAIACFETAMQQGSESATTIHLVSAVEALARPNYKKAWHNRVTQRYREFLLGCVPDKLTEVMAHANLSMAFPKVKTIEQLVDAIYSSRSSSVHNGHAGEFHEAFGGENAIRVMFLADIVRSAIIQFAKSPFTSLVGHPVVDNAISIKLDNLALALFRERAIAQSMSVEDYIASLAFK